MATHRIVFGGAAAPLVLGVAHGSDPSGPTWSYADLAARASDVDAGAVARLRSRDSGSSSGEDPTDAADPSQCTPADTSFVVVSDTSTIESASAERTTQMNLAIGAAPAAPKIGPVLHPTVNGVDLFVVRSRRSPVLP